MKDKLQILCEIRNAAKWKHRFGGNLIKLDQYD